MTCKKCGAKIDGRKNKCLCCGFQPKSGERKTWLWVLGWIFIFPLPLTLIILRNNDSKDKVKYAAVGLAWAAYLLIVIFGGSRENDPNRQLRDRGNAQVAVQPTIETTNAVADAAETEPGNAELARMIPNADRDGKHENGQ